MRPTTLSPHILRTMLAVSLLLGQGTTGLAAQSSNRMYHLSRDIRLGGDGRWDYVSVDTAAHRLFIARQTRVMVVDQASGRLLAEIPGLDGAHGVALAYRAGHGFATSGRDSSVTMFDLRTLKVLRRTHAAVDADAILYDPASGRVFTFNGDAGTSTAIDPASGAVLGTVPLEGKPEFGVSDGDGRVYVNIEDKGEVAQIDPVRLHVVRRWSIAPCEEPTGLAIDRARHLLFSVCRNAAMVISDAAAGSKVAEVPIGQGVDGAAFDPATRLAFASNGEGTLTVVHEDSPTAFHVVSTVPTRRGARTLALDERTHRLYTVTAGFGPPPAATATEPHPRPSLIPGTFSLLVLER
jgi:DNA-binding beta-propeller fold protein YncE